MSSLVPKNLPEDKQVVHSFATRMRMDGTTVDIIDDAREKPDAELLIEEEKWGIEVTSYRQDDPRKNYEGYDDALRDCFREHWRLNKRLQHASVKLFFRQMSSKGSLSVPPIPRHKDFVHELDRLVTNELDAATTGEHVLFRFEPPFHMEYCTIGRKIDPTSYPLLEKHCVDIEVQHLNRGISITLETTLNSGTGFLDVDVLVDRVKEKCRKLDDYKKNLPQSHMGLVIYAKNWPHTYWMIPGDEHEAARVITEAHSRQSTRFDRVWLFPRALLIPEPGPLIDCA